MTSKIWAHPEQDPGRCLRIWLDDMRPLPREYKRSDGWIILRDGESLLGLVDAIGLHKIVTISFDHDLGPSRYWTGYDTIKRIEAIVRERELMLVPEMRVHSADPVGSANIRSVIERIGRYVQELEDSCYD